MLPIPGTRSSSRFPALPLPGFLLPLSPLVRPFAVYRLRWEIENLFQSLKGRGFHWEDTRITKYFRIKKIMALLAIAFSWAHKVGEWKHDFVKPLLIKKHGRPEQSLFRYGLDHLTNHLLHGFREATEAIKLLVLFLWPPNLIARVGGNVKWVLKFTA